MTSDLQTNNQNHRRKKKIDKQQQFPSSSLRKRTQVKSVSYIDPNATYDNTSMTRQIQEQIPMKNSLSWKKRWTHWFSSCNSERIASHMRSTSIPIALIKKHSRTKSENDLSKRTNAVDQDEKKNHSTLVVNQHLNEHLPKTSSHQQHHHHQSIEKVNNCNSVIYRDTSRHQSNRFFSSFNIGQEHQSRTSFAGLSSSTKTFQDSHSKQPLSRSADRLNSKLTRRELRYEEHNDFIPSPLNSIQCHPTVDNHARNLNQSSSSAAYFYSKQRRSHIEVYQYNSSVSPRPYSYHIPVQRNFVEMSQSPTDNNETYDKLSDCHSPLIPVENSTVKAPRRIESVYSQFPLGQHEPVYANTQSLYDNILYPSSSTTKITNRQEKKSCASQTQLTWTMATFSSFVDLENQSIIIQQPDPTTLYSIVRHQQTELPPSASQETIEQMKRISPNLQYGDEIGSSTTAKSLFVEKRDGSFQTLLTISPAQPVHIHESTPSPVSTGSSSTTDHHRHHRHRRHKSRSHTSRSNISTRDVGLQVNIQTVKKITFISEKNDDESLTTSTSSPPTVKISREFRNIQTNTDIQPTKQDRSTSYESTVQYVSSSSQTFDAPIDVDRQTKSAQTSTRSLRDQSIETNHQGLFVCDLSSFLKTSAEDIPLKLIKQKT